MTDDSLHDSLMRGLQQTLAYAKGDASHVRIVTAPRTLPDVKKIRKRLKKNQRDFALAYHINPSTLRSWEQGKRTPPDYAIAYLKIIEQCPGVVEEALAS
jgi:putative transcriptional regulator